MKLYKKRIIKVLSVLFVSAICTIAITFVFNDKPDAGFSTDNILNHSEKEWLSLNRNKISVTIDPGYAPVSYIDETGNFNGITAEYLKLIEKKLNITFIRIYSRSWSESLELGITGKADIVGAAAWTEERTKYFIFTPSFIELPTLFVIRKGITDRQQISDFTDDRIAVGESYAVKDYIAAKYPQMNLISVFNDLDGLRMVSSGELNAAITDLASASYYMRMYNFKNLTFSADTGFTYKLCFAVNRANPLLAGILIKTIAGFSDEEKNNIISKWISLEGKDFFQNKKIINTALIFIITTMILLIILTIWNHSLSLKVKKQTFELSIYKNRLEEIVKERTGDLNESVEKLNDAIQQVKTLNGLLPICAGCKKIRSDKGYWQSIEEYMKNYTLAEFSQSICPDCNKRLYDKS